MKLNDLRREKNPDKRKVRSKKIDGDSLLEKIDGRWDHRIREGVTKRTKGLQSPL